MFYNNKLNYYKHCNIHKTKFVDAIIAPFNKGSKISLANKQKSALFKLQPLLLINNYFFRC